ncbi:MAG: FliM/FliN family flagellar motor switch protein [Pseudomonadota bacterium]
MAESAAVLSKKVSVTTINADGFPELGTFSTALSKAVSVCVSELLDAPTMPTTYKGRIQQLRDLFANAPLMGSYSWITDAVDQQAVLIVIQNPMVSALTDRLLGGRATDVPDRKITTIDAELSYQLADALIPALNRVVQRLSGPNDEIAMMQRASTQLPDEAKGELEMLTVYSVSISLDIDDTIVDNAITLCFPIDYVERAGFMSARVTQVRPSEESPWRMKLSRNVRNLDINAHAVLARLEQSVGNISNLKPGDIVPLPDGVIDMVELIVETSEGDCVIATGQLGSVKETKAIKLADGVDPAFVPPF